MGKHFFDTDIAVQLGVNAALIYEHIRYWCEHNEAAKKNYYDGSYWMYSSGNALHEQLPYLTAGAIRTALHKLEDAGYIKKGNYNNTAMNRTLWYAVAKKVNT